MEEINLYDLLRYYARNWLNLLSAALVGAIIGVAYTGFIQVPLYKSDATMLVIGTSASQDATINNNYTELFSSRRVLDTVIKQQDYKGDYEQLSSRTTATNSKDTDVLKVSIADTDPATSQQLLDASLDVFGEEAKALYGSSNIKTVDTASLPASPYNVKIITQVGLAIAATFFFAVIVMFFVYDYKQQNGGSPSLKKDSSKNKRLARRAFIKAAGNDNVILHREKTTKPKRSGHRLLELLIGNKDTSSTATTKKTK